MEFRCDVLTVKNGAVYVVVSSSNHVIPRLNHIQLVLTIYKQCRKVLPLLWDFLSPCKSPCKSPVGRILGGSSLQTAPTNLTSGKSMPGRYSAIVRDGH